MLLLRDVVAPLLLFRDGVALLLEPSDGVAPLILLQDGVSLFRLPLLRDGDAQWLGLFGEVALLLGLLDIVLFLLGVPRGGIAQVPRPLLEGILRLLGPRDGSSSTLRNSSSSSGSTVSGARVANTILQLGNKMAHLVGLRPDGLALSLRIRVETPPVLVPIPHLLHRHSPENCQARWRAGDPAGWGAVHLNAFRSRCSWVP